MKLTVKNREELDKFFQDNYGDHLRSTQGPAPAGATDSRGDPIERPVNIAWKNMRTGDRVDIRYE